MDETELQAAFRAAADGGPDAGFGHADVVRASDRITARRRSQVRGTVAALVVVAGLGGVGGAVALNRPSASNATAAGSAAPEQAARPPADTQLQAGPGGGAAAGGAETFAAPPAADRGVPLGPGTGLCANLQDPALRALLNAALPGAAAAPEAATHDICLPSAQRSVSIEFGGDVLTVAYLPPGAVVDPAEGMINGPTASGGTVLVPQAYPQLLAALGPRL